MVKVEKQLAEKQAWYDKQFAACMQAKKTDNPPVLCAQIKTECEVRTRKRVCGSDAIHFASSCLFIAL